MPNPFRVLAEQFVRRSTAALLAFGVVISLIDFAALYAATAREGVLRISQGIGLFNNYGLFSTVVGNAIFIYAAKKYYEGVCSAGSSRAVLKSAPVKESLSALTTMIEMRGRYRFVLYSLAMVGALAWLSNVSSHVIGDPEVRWGHKVFDSPDHPLTFIASRLHNLYTWVLVLPLVGHVIICSSVQLWRAVLTAAREGALGYDLLNPDRRGGFGFIDRTAVAFNVIVALVYIQITLHIETFAQMNADHVVAYLALTLLLAGVDRMFLGGIYAAIKTLRLESLNRVKDKVYGDDKLSFEILKYCYERRVTASSVVNFAINPGAILVSGALKLWPLISKTFNGA